MVIWELKTSNVAFLAIDRMVDNVYRMGHSRGCSKLSASDGSPRDWTDGLRRRNPISMASHTSVQLDVFDKREGHERMCNSHRGVSVILAKWHDW